MVLLYTAWPCWTEANGILFQTIVSFITCVVFGGIWRFRDWLVFFFLLTGYELPTLPSSQACRCSLMNSLRSSLTGPSTQIRESHRSFGCTRGSLCKKNWSAFQVQHRLRLWWGVINSMQLQKCNFSSWKLNIDESTLCWEQQPSICEASSLINAQSESFNSGFIRMKHTCDASYFWSRWHHLEVSCVWWHHFTPIYF